jgi:hypothetical protein
MSLVRMLRAGMTVAQGQIREYYLMLKSELWDKVLANHVACYPEQPQPCRGPSTEGCQEDTLVVEWWAMDQIGRGTGVGLGER